MKVLIAHLSDIHLQIEDNPVVARAPHIARAIASWSTDVDICVLAVTGDIAYSGRAEEYEVAGAFLARIEAELRETCNSLKIVHVLVPGNHDCDYSSIGNIRQIAIDSIRDKPDQADESVLRECTLPQSSYFAWQKVLIPSTTNIVHQLRWQIEVDVGHECMTFHCFNTAWASKKRETQGLPIPSSMLPDDRVGRDLSIAMFHHPNNWLDPSSSREFENSLTQSVDLVLTGHEHTPDHTSETSAVRKSTLSRIEGGALQETNDPSRSSFNLILVDSIRREQKFSIFSWADTLYSQQMDGEWRRFMTNPARPTVSIGLNEQTLNWLRDPELILKDADGDNVLLDDFFVFPDLRQVTLPGSRGEVIKGEHLADAIVARPNPILITGNDESGKTALAKMLVLRFAKQGILTLLVNGADLPRNASKLESFFADRFVSQYQSSSRDVFLQTTPDKRVIIIDDYHAARPSRKLRSKWLESFSKLGKLVLLATDVVLDVDEIVRPESVAFDRFSIQALSHVRRGELVENWLRRTAPEDQTEAEFARSVRDVSSKLNTIIGKNFVPAYAPYILAVLTADQASTPLDLRASTHGYFYELFIRTALAKGRTSVQFDIVNAYLSHFAYRLFTKDTRSVNTTTARAIHGEYQIKHDIVRDFEPMHNTLESQGIIDNSNNEVRFRYNYIYYYFVAAYIRDHLTDQVVRNQVRAMTSAIHIEDNANILLFLAHLSKDPLIIEEMLAAARSLYSSDQPCQLTDDVVSTEELTNLGTAMKTFADGDQRRAREQELAALDAAEDQEDTLVPASADPMNPVVQVQVMLKTIQILGQIAKNFPGSLEAETKQSIVRECTDLALRALSSVYALVQKDRANLLELFAGAIQFAHPNYQSDRIIRRAQETLVSLTSLTALGVVKRVAQAVGSPDLEGTYIKTLREEVPAERLILLSLRLEHVGTFPANDVRQMSASFKSHYLASWVLRTICISYFRTFPAPSSLKQSVCSQLGIEYEQVNLDDSKMLLPGN